MLVIITGTINPSSEVPFLELKSDTVRLAQYESSIRHLISCKYIHKLVFCDNSMFELDTRELHELARNNDKEFEYLTFNSDTEKVNKQGKGYGEGELIKYVIENSKLLKDEKYFYKLTGRLILLNIDEILAKSNENTNYFNKATFFDLNNKVDTRFYGIKIKDYKRYFLTAYQEVDDYTNNYLEHVFYNVIKENAIQHKNMPIYPKIEGVSGSSGESYKLSGVNYFVKNICCKFGAGKI